MAPGTKGRSQPPKHRPSKNEARSLKRKRDQGNLGKLRQAIEEIVSKPTSRFLLSVFFLSSFFLLDSSSPALPWQMLSPSCVYSHLYRFKFANVSRNYH